jgi:Flp pilus assembly protein TadD
VNPYDALAFFNLGNSLFRQEKRDSAEFAYRRAAELDPSLAPAQFNLPGSCCCKARKGCAASAARGAGVRRQSC